MVGFPQFPLVILRSCSYTTDNGSPDSFIHRLDCIQSVTPKRQSGTLIMVSEVFDGMLAVVDIHWRLGRGAVMTLKMLSIALSLQKNKAWRRNLRSQMSGLGS